MINMLKILISLPFEYKFIHATHIFLQRNSLGSCSTGQSFDGESLFVLVVRDFCLRMNRDGDRGDDILTNVVTLKVFVALRRRTLLISV